MEIRKDNVVTIHFHLTQDDGSLLDSSRDSEPFGYLHGAGNIVPGLEAELEGKKKGDKIITRVLPEKGYGLRNEDLVQDIPRNEFDDKMKIEPGMQFEAESEEGIEMVTVISADADTVTVDGNHPLAGIALNFEVEVINVREATREELDHGHVHDGHHHH